MFLKKIEPFLQDTLKKTEYLVPTKVEKTCIPKIKSGIDIIINAPTGSGKTSSIVITVIQQLKKAEADVPRALIITSSIEETERIKAQFETLGKNTNLRVFCESDTKKLEDLRDLIYFGSDIVILTAKKVNELYFYNGINLNGLKMFIVDDAELVMRDQILSQINKFAPNLPKCQRIVFCNKFNHQTQHFQKEFMNFPEILDFSKK